MLTTTLPKERLERQLLALNEVAITLTRSMELPELLNAVMDCIIGVLEQAQAGVIMLWDQSAGLFRPAAMFGFNPTVMRDMGLRLGESVTGKVFDEGNARLLGTPEEIDQMMADMRQANRLIFEQATGTETPPLSILAAPLKVSDQKYGVLVLENLHGQVHLDEHDLPFVQSIADLVALAIDRARLEAKADAIRQAQQAERMRSEVTAALSHQLRLPLSSIKGYTTAMLLDDIDWNREKRREFLNLIDSECDNMETLIKEILDSAIIDVGQLSIGRQPLRLQHMSDEIAQDFQRHHPGHRLLIDFPANFPIIEADPRWMRQVFRNILDNSIKYSPEGGLVIIHGEVRPGDVVISIADQGVGISPEDLIPLFEKFFRVKSPDGLRVPGTGLGLPIARAIIEAHGGRIWAESKLKEGTTIYFSLPRPKMNLSEDI
jgi:K+-sensing histidine kinase KdpD